MHRSIQLLEICILKYPKREGWTLSLGKVVEVLRFVDSIWKLLLHDFVCILSTAFCQSLSIFVICTEEKNTTKDLNRDDKNREVNFYKSILNTRVQ